MAAIPTRYIGTGNIARAKTLTGVGRKHLDKLRHNMSFQSLPTGRSTVRYPDGTVIECFANHGLSEVRIHVPSGGPPMFREEKSCWCFPHLSFAVVKAVKPDQASQEFLAAGRFTYDVEICATTRYIFYADVLDANFGKYYVGQYVLVAIGAAMDAWENPLDCQRRCLMEEPQFDVLTISPLHILGKMKKWNIELY